MTRKERYEAIIEYFREHHPDAGSELRYTNPFELLVATLLSAQCTDKRINQVTPALFARYPDAKSMSEATEQEVLEYVKSVSYPNAKSRHLVAMAQVLVRDFGGVVPQTTEQLVTLPGVGRKTANVVQAVAFGKSTMAVDTHVYRVSHRLGLVASTDDTPYKVEQRLVRHIPAAEIPRAHHWLLLHGRYVCTSRKPHCGECPFAAWCPGSQGAEKGGDASCVAKVGGDASCVASTKDHQSPPCDAGRVASYVASAKEGGDASCVASTKDHQSPTCDAGRVASYDAKTKEGGDASCVASTKDHQSPSCDAGRVASYDAKTKEGGDASCVARTKEHHSPSCDAGRVASYVASAKEHQSPSCDAGRVASYVASAKEHHSPPCDARRVASYVASASYLDKKQYVSITGGKLPHWYQPGRTQFVTFRLEDSLPQSKLEELSQFKVEWQKSHPQPWTEQAQYEYDHEIRKKVDNWLDQGLGSCVLKRSEIRKIVEDALLHFDGKRYTLHAYVIMPNHVHILLTPIGEENIVKAIGSVKSFSAKAINRKLGSTGVVWQRQVFDRMVRDAENFYKYVIYINNNPSRLAPDNFIIGGDASCVAGHKKA